MADAWQFFQDWVLHLPAHLEAFVAEHGPWVYALLGAIVFAETGLVVTPFLPGDSLLFAAGALAGSGHLNLWIVSAVLLAAAIAGDAVNYAVGRWLSDRVMSGAPIPLIKRKHIDKTHAFYDKYGPKAIVLARFVPIVRTFAPFVAGVGRMDYRTFALYNVVGAVAWVVVCVGAGYVFGNMPWVKRNFELVIVGIIVVSVLPMAVEIVLARRAGVAAARGGPAPGAGGRGGRSG